MKDLREVISQIKLDADIVAVVGRHVPSLKKAGANSYKACCPFHDEKTPSFNVNPAKNTFYCFGCHEGGSVIDFMMKAERLEFIEAVERLAKEMGIEFERGGPSEDPGARDAKEKKLRALQSVSEFALEWFENNLKKDLHREARGYLERRDITPEMAAEFRLGVALEGWDNLIKAASARGFSERVMEDAGLVIRHEIRGTCYDRFRNRLIFPIFDHLGRITGFGGRAFDDSKPKYLNSNETDLYKKSRTLYALNVAEKAITSSGYAIITEGYMDALMAHRYGLRQAVAVLSSSLAAEQVRLLKRYTTRVYMMLDGDAAGRSGMMRSAEPLLEAGFDARVIVLPPGMDPDDFLKAHGAEALEKLREGAPELFDFALDEMSLDLDLDSIAGRTELAQRAAPLLLAMKNEVQHEVALSRLLGRLGGLSREVILRMLDRARSRTREEQRTPAHQPTATSPHKPAPPRIPEQDLDPLEKYALKLMLEDYRALQTLRADLSESWLTDERLRPWIEYFLSGEHDAARMMDEAESTGEFPGPREIISRLLIEEIPLGDVEHSAHQLTLRLKKRHLRISAERLIRQLQQLKRENIDARIPSNILNAIHHEALLAHRLKLPNAPWQHAQKGKAS